MKALLLSLALLFGCCTCVLAQSLNQFRWKARPLILFTPNAEDPVFQKQVRVLQGMEEAFEERNIKILFLMPEGTKENTGLFADEATSRSFYNYFGVQPYQFEMILVGLDGHEKFRARNTITPPSVILEIVDGMPMRRREILQGRGNKSMITRENDASPAAQRY